MAKLDFSAIRSGGVSKKIEAIEIDGVEFNVQCLPMAELDALDKEFEKKKNAAKTEEKKSEVIISHMIALFSRCVVDVDESGAVVDQLTEDQARKFLLEQVSLSTMNKVYEAILALNMGKPYEEAEKKFRTGGEQPE